MIESGSADLLAQLRAIQSAEDEIPEDFKTTTEWAKEWNLSDSHTQKLLRDGVKAGILERQTFHRRTESGVYPVPHYKQCSSK